MDSHQKLERLAKLLAEDKKEGKIEFEDPTAKIRPPIVIDEEGNLANPKFENEFEKVINQMIYKLIIKSLPPGTKGNKFL